VIGKIEAFLDDRIDVDDPMLAGAFARVQQHVLDDGVGTLAVLYNLVEISPQGVRQFGDLNALAFAHGQVHERGAQLIDQFGRQA